jgi:hypothetical protein
MANPPIGNNVWEGVLGVVTVTFNDIDMGKTNDQTSIQKVEDVQDIFFQQDGTQPSDKIPTGQAYEVSCTFAQLTTTRLEQLMRGFDKSDDANSNSVKLGRDIYRSGKDNFSKKLILKRVDSDGNASSDQNFWITYYLAMPTNFGEINWGADVQRNLSVTFYCFYSDAKGAFGYSGIASSVGLTPA